jgi:hypothetical protein
VGHNFGKSIYLGATMKAKPDTFSIIGRKIEKCDISVAKNRRFMS